MEEKTGRRIEARVVTRQDAYREASRARKLAAAKMAALLGPEASMTLKKGVMDKEVPYVDLDVELYFSEPVEVYIDCPEKAPSKKTCFRALFLLEPEEVSGCRRKLREMCETKFDAVFGRCEGEIFFGHGGSWVPRGMLTRRYPKTGAVSFICGDKKSTRGHKLRLALWRKSLPSEWTKFASSRAATVLEGGRPLGADIEAKAKDAIAPFQYHVAIENVRENSYFSEKLLDCFLLRTVPVYWGCPNVADFFDIDGILLIQDHHLPVEDLADRILDAVSSELDNPDNLARRAAAVEANYHAALTWIDLQDRMQRALDAVLPVDHPTTLLS